MKFYIARHFALAVLAVSGAAGAAFCQDLTDADRTKGIQYLTESYLGVVGATKDLSPEQWRYKPAADRWSIAEIVEHLGLAEDFTLSQVMKEPAKSSGAAPVIDTKQVDALMMAMIPDRTTKFTAPPMLVPSGRLSPEAALEHFTADYRQLDNLLRTSGDLRRRTAYLPPLKQQVDYYEFLLATAGHIERHTKQILEVKASPGFPSK